MALSTTPIAYYDFTEGSGTTLTDRQSGTYNGTLGLSGANLPTWAGNGLNFGGNALVALPPTLWAASPLSMHFALSCNELTGMQAVLWGQSQPLTLGAGGCAPSVGVPGNNAGAFASQPITGNHLLTFTLGTTPRLYIDGVEVKGYFYQDAGIFSPSFATPSTLWLGFGGVTVKLTGTMWFNSYHATELTPTQVAADYTYISGLMSGRAASFGVDTHAAVPLLYCRGDSITYGTGSGDPANWPVYAWTQLGGSGVYRLVIAGVGGQLISAMNTNMAQSLGGLTIPAGSIAVLEGGTNDYTGTTTALVSTNSAALYAAWVSAYQSLIGFGFSKVIVADLLPRTDASMGTGFAALRVAARALMVADTANFPRLCLWGKDANIGVDTAPNATTFYSGDHIHPNQTGTYIMNGYISSAIAAPSRFASGGAARSRIVNLN